MNCAIGRNTEAYSIWSTYMSALICRIGMTIARQHFLLSFGCGKIHTISELSAFVSIQPESSPGDVSLIWKIPGGVGGFSLRLFNVCWAASITAWGWGQSCASASAGAAVLKVGSGHSQIMTELKLEFTWCIFSLQAEHLRWEKACYLLIGKRQHNQICTEAGLF